MIHDTQRRFEKAEVAADWRQLTVPQRILRSSALTNNWTRGAVSRHYITPVSYIRL